MPKIKNLAKQITPPILLDFYNKKNKKYGFFGNYKDWEEAQKKSSGYDSDLIIEKVKNSALKVKNGEAAYERDSVIFDKKDYAWPLLANLLWIASVNNNNLNIIDFGGALGTSYFQNKDYFSHLRSFNWNIIEQEKFVEYGKKLFANNTLNFYFTINDCLSEQKPNLILFSSVLQYLEDPYELIKEVLKKNFDFIILDRTTIAGDNQERITVQKVPPKIYDASYPCRFFSEKKLLDYFNNGYSLINEWRSFPETTIELDGTTAIYKGYLFKRNK